MDIDIIEAIILGIVQGATEFLPVSSSAHLVIVPYFFGMPPAPLIFDAMVHMATLLAVMLFFWNDLFNIAVSFFKNDRSEETRSNKKVGLLIIAGTVPAALAGYFFEDFFAGFFSAPEAVGFLLLVTGSFLLLIERIAKQVRNIRELNFKNAVFIGIAQSFAILPGISRSGSTIVAGMFCGLTRESATRFSFLLSVPIIFGAGLFSIKKAFFDHTWADINIIVMLAGCFAAFVAAFLSIKFLISYVKKHSLDVFAIYCFVVGILVLLLGLVRD